MKKLFVMTAAMLAVGMASAAPAIRPLTMQEMARYGATDALTVGAGDLTVTTDNAAQTNTFTLSGPCSWEYIGFSVDAPFDSTLTTNALSSTLTLTAGSDTLISELQIASDTWRPYKTSWASAPTVTTIGPATNQLVSTLSAPYKGVITNGGTLTVTMVISGPEASTSLSEIDTGQARVFLRIMR